RSLGDRVIDVSEQRKREVVLTREACLALLVQHADAQDDGIVGAEVRQRGLEGARLARAARRVVLRVEVEHHVAAAVVGEAMRRAVLVVEGEIGRGRARVEWCCHLTCSRSGASAAVDVPTPYWGGCSPTALRSASSSARTRSRAARSRRARRASLKARTGSK